MIGEEDARPLWVMAPSLSKRAGSRVGTAGWLTKFSRCSCPSFPVGMAWLPFPMEAQAPSAAGRGKAQASFDSLLQTQSGDDTFSAREGTVLIRTEAQELF